MTPVVRLDRSRGARIRSAVPPGVLLSVLSSAFAQAVIVIPGIAVARALGPSDRGLFSLLTLTAAGLGYIGTLGIPLALTVAISTRLPSRMAMWKVLRRMIAWQATLLLVCAVIWVSIAFLLGGARHAMLSAIAASSLPLWLPIHYGMGILQGCEDLWRFHLARILHALTYAVAVCAVLALHYRHLPIVLGVWSASCLLAGVLILWLTANTLPERSGDEPPSSREMTRVGLRSLPGTLSPLDTLRLDQLVVALVLPVSGLGLYTVAQTLMSLPRLIAQGFGFVTLPRMARVQVVNTNPLPELFRFVALMSALTIVTSAILAIAAGHLIPAIFGESFRGSITPARVLLAAAVLLSVRRLLADGARGLGRGQLDTAAELTLWIAFLPGAFFAGSRWGVTGAAAALTAASACSVGVLVVLMVFSNRSRHALKPGHLSQP